MPLKAQKHPLGSTLSFTAQPKYHSSAGARLYTSPMASQVEQLMKNRFDRMGNSGTGPFEHIDSHMALDLRSYFEWPLQPRCRPMRSPRQALRWLVEARLLSQLSILNQAHWAPKLNEYVGPHLATTDHTKRVLGCLFAHSGPRPSKCTGIAAHTDAQI